MTDDMQEDETRADFIAKIAELYDVPMTLIRYDDTLQHIRQEGMVK